jgi:hypothetical protein
MMARRRSEKSFRSDADKAAARRMLREMETAALERLETGDGLRNWLIARSLHGGFDCITPANAAVAAFQKPGDFVAKKPFWGSIPKGITADCVLIGRTYWPDAAWSASRMGQETQRYLMERAHHVDPDPERCERLADSWAKVANTVGALQSFVFAYGDELDVAAGPLITWEDVQVRVNNAEPAETVSDGIPF